MTGSDVSESSILTGCGNAPERALCVRGVAWCGRRVGIASVVVTGDMLDALPGTPAGGRARWVLERLAAVGSGEAPPSIGELDEHYTSAWLSEVPMSWVFYESALLMAAVTAVFAKNRRARTRSRSYSTASTVTHCGSAVPSRRPHRIGSSSNS
jgi:hypothetical protein